MVKHPRGLWLPLPNSDLSPFTAALVFCVKPRPTPGSKRQGKGTHLGTSPCLWGTQKEGGQSSSAAWMVLACLFIQQILKEPGRAQALVWDSPYASCLHGSSGPGQTQTHGGDECHDGNDRCRESEQGTQEERA